MLAGAVNYLMFMEVSKHLIQWQMLGGRGGIRHFGIYHAQCPPQAVYCGHTARQETAAARHSPIPL